MATIALTEERTTGSASALRPGPLFVVGMWRSGTSLLYALLNQHSQISLMYEAELPVLKPLFMLRGGKSDWTKRWNFWNSALDRHQIPADEIPDSVKDLPSAVRAVYGLRPTFAAAFSGQRRRIHGSASEASRTAHSSV